MPAINIPNAVRTQSKEGQAAKELREQHKVEEEKVEMIGKQVGRLAEGGRRGKR